MRRLAPALLAVASMGACGNGRATTPATTTVTASISTAGVSTTALRPTTTVVAPPVSRAATALIEPDAVAGLALGATKTEVIAVLGSPTQMGQETDLGGAKYDYLRWELDGTRGLTLNFRSQGVTSPRLTDWIATAPGPRTRSGVQVGNSATTVIAAHGALEPFCCDSKVASVKQGAGHMIVVVKNGGAVIQITGGDQSAWSRSIAD